MAMKRGGKLMVNTAVPGSTRNRYLDGFRKYAVAHGKEVTNLELGEMIFEHADHVNIRMTRKNVLNTSPYTMQGTRGGPLQQINGELPYLLHHKKSAVVLNMHAMFYWRHAYAGAFDNYYLNAFAPDLYVNFLDDVDTTARQLKQREQWQRELFSPGLHPTYAVEKILDWQSAEVEVTRMWAQRDRKPFFVIPTKSSPSFLYRLLFEPWRKIFYVGMPLTLLSGDQFEDARKRINDLIAWLEHYVVVVDPRHVEPLSKRHLSHIYHPMYDQVVRRDLLWLIPQCDGMIAFFPEKAFSAGVTCEIREVHETNGEVFLIYPPGPISPFLTRWTDYPLFRHEKAFKEFFLKWLGVSYVAKAERSYAIDKRLRILLKIFKIFKRDSMLITNSDI